MISVPLSAFQIHRGKQNFTKNRKVPLIMEMLKHSEKLNKIKPLLV